MKKRDSSLVRSRGAVAAAVVAGLLAVNVAAATPTHSSRPTLEIFSKDIVDSIKETGIPVTGRANAICELAQL